MHKLYLYRYRACYAYEIDSGRCTLNLGSLTVHDLSSGPQENSTLIEVDTPSIAGGVYPVDTICFFVIGNRYAVKLTIGIFICTRFIAAYFPL